MWILAIGNEFSGIQEPKEKYRGNLIGLLEYFAEHVVQGQWVEIYKVTSTGKLQLQDRGKVV